MAGGTVKFEIFTQAEAVDVLDAAVHHIQQAVRLFGMAAAQGVSESQMVEVLRRQVFPSLKTEELQHLAKIFSHVRDSEVGGKAEGKRPLEPTTEEDGDPATQPTNKAQKMTESTITAQQCMIESIQSQNLVDPSQQVPELGATDPQTGICKAVQSLPGAQTAQDLSRQPMLAVAVAAAAEPANVSQMPDASANKYAASLTPEKEHSNGVFKAEIPNSHRGSPLPGLLPGLGAGPRATGIVAAPLPELPDEHIRKCLKVDVSHESCSMIRTINRQLHKLASEGIVRYIRSEGDDNCVWGFRVLEVSNPLAFNQSFRELVAVGRGENQLKKPTEVFMKTLRFCGVTARRGARGPKETDPDPRDFMYSYYYDFVSSKEEYNRRKLCAYGYSKEAREIAGQHKGEFLNSEWMPKRKDLLKAAAESRAAAGPICNGAAGAGASAGGGAVPGGAGIGLDVLWEVVSKDFGQYNPKDRGAPQGGGYSGYSESSNASQAGGTPPPNHSALLAAGMTSPVGRSSLVPATPSSTCFDSGAVDMSLTCGDDAGENP